MESQGTSTGESATPPSGSPAPSFRQVQAHVVPAPPITTAVQVARRQLYLFSPSDVGLMQPAVDAHGNVWAGEMNTNRLGRLDSRTGAVSNWTPPGAQYGIMTTIVDAQGNAWFAEQNANYIGRFDPARQAFRLFPLGTWKGNPLGPQDLHFDGEGKLWFTAALAGAIGRLDPTTGAIRIWPVPSPAPGMPTSPYCLTVAPNGLVWFGYYDGGAIGSLDPATGQVTLYRLQDPHSQIFAMATDAAGRLWFTEIPAGQAWPLRPGDRRPDRNGDAGGGRRLSCPVWACHRPSGRYLVRGRGRQHAGPLQAGKALHDVLPALHTFQRSLRPHARPGRQPVVHRRGSAGRLRRGDDPVAVAAILLQ